MSKVYRLIFNAILPRVLEEMKTKLQLYIDTKIGDWFLYKDYTIIMVYGFTKGPYSLLSFIAPRIFALEFIKKILQSETEHFLNFKKASNFKIPSNIGPLVVKSKSTLSVVERLMKVMNFKEMKKIRYDPYHVISQRREQNKIIPFEYQEIEGLDKLANLENLDQEDQMSE